MVNESALIGLHLQPFFVPFYLRLIAWHVEGVFCPPGALHSVGGAIYRQKPLGRVIEAFVGVTGGGWIDRIPPRCHRAKMRGIFGSPHVSYGVGFSGRLEGGKWVVNERRSEGVFTAF